MTSLPNVALTIPAKPKPQIKTVDLAFAHLSLLLAYLFVKNGLFSAPGAGFTGFALLFVAASLAYAKIKTGRLTAPAYTGAVLISAFSLVFILSDNGYLKTWALLFECIGVLYWYFRMFGEREDTRVDDTIIDLIHVINEEEYHPYDSTDNKKDTKDLQKFKQRFG